MIDLLDVLPLDRISLAILQDVSGRHGGLYPIHPRHERAI